MPSVKLPDGRIIHFPDGMSPDTIQAEVARLADVEAGTRKDSPAPERSWTDTAVDALPVIGGTVGSFVGAGKWNPLGMAGAAAGGAGGAFVKQIINAARGSDDVPSTLGGQLSDAAEEGAIQAGLQGGTRLALGGGARVIKGIRKIADVVPSETAKKIGTDVALDMVPGGRSVRAVARAVVRGMQQPVTESAAPAVAESAAPAIEGFERYLPNIGAASHETLTAPQSELLHTLMATPAEEVAPRAVHIPEVIKHQSDFEKGRELGRLLSKLSQGRGGT